MEKETRLKLSNNVMYIVGGINPIWDTPYSDTWGRFSNKVDAIEFRLKLKSNGFIGTYIKKRINVKYPNYYVN